MATMGGFKLRLSYTILGMLIGISGTVAGELIAYLFVAVVGKL